MEIKVLNNGNAKVINIGFTSADGFVKGEALYVSKTPIKGILGSSVQDDQVQFVCMNGVPLGERLKQPMSKVQYFLIMQQLAAIARDIKSLNLSIDKLLLDFRYVFINETSWEVQLAYTPCAAKANANNLISFMSAISAMTKPFREADMEYAQRFLAFLKSVDGFDYTRIESYILNEDAKVVDAVNKSHPSRNVVINNQNESVEQVGKTAPSVKPEPIAKAVNLSQVPEINIADMLDDNSVGEEQPTKVQNPVAQSMPISERDEAEDNTALLIEDAEQAQGSSVAQSVEFNAELDDTSLLIEEDASDIEKVAEKSDDGFVFKPEVAPVVQPAPQPVVKPAPQPQPAVKPKVQPTPAPQPQPVAKPMAQPVPASAAAVKPAYELSSDEVMKISKGAPAPQPMVKPVPQPVAQPAPAPQPMVKPAPQPVAQPAPAPQPVVKPAPQPVAQPAPAPQPVVKPVPQPVAQPAPAPQPVVKPAPQPVAQPAPAPQPMVKPAPQPVAQPTPAPQSVMMSGGFDEDKTGLLTDEPFAPMDTYSNGSAPEKEYIKYPTLKRIFNGDVVKISKPVFRIGKERSYVDYFVSNSNVISRSHADIIIRDNRYFITDLNSKNKTYINGRMIMPNCEIEIFDGDTITLANEDFLFKV